MKLHIPMIFENLNTCTYPEDGLGAKTMAAEKPKTGIFGGWKYVHS